MIRRRRPGGGRKPLSKQGRREQVNFRATPELLAVLRKEAEQNGRTLTAEIEYRLFGEGPDRDFAVATVEVAQLIRLWFRRSWQGDRWAFDLFEAGVRALLPHFMPEGEAQAPENVRVDTQTLGEALATATMAKRHGGAKANLEPEPRLSAAERRIHQRGIEHLVKTAIRKAEEEK
jgi:hypothetical protein